jgi:complex iron-sulfur molybdoenzyme family reductase subunit gamma
LQLATKTLLNAGAFQWKKVPAEELRMAGARVDLQPSRYVRTVWAGRAVGAVRNLKVQTAHNSRDILFRLEWPDESKDTDFGDGSVFPDAASVLFPLKGDAPLETMGSPRSPINAWYWRANFPPDEARNRACQGYGSEEDTSERQVQARARWEDGRWYVVFARPLAANGKANVKLGSAQPGKVAFAVWEGSSQERGGLHSCSRQWLDLVIE